MTSTMESKRLNERIQFVLKKKKRRKTSSPSKKNWIYFNLNSFINNMSTEPRPPNQDDLSLSLGLELLLRDPNSNSNTNANCFFFGVPVTVMMSDA